MEQTKHLERARAAAERSHDRPMKSAIGHLLGHIERLENRLERAEARAVELYAIVDAIQEAQMIGNYDD